MKFNSLFLVPLLFTISLFAAEKSELTAMVTTHRPMLQARTIIEAQIRQRRKMTRARLQQAVKSMMRSSKQHKKFEAEKYASNKAHAQFHEAEIARLRKQAQKDLDHYLHIIDDQRQKIDALSDDYAKMRAELRMCQARLASLTTALDVMHKQETDAVARSLAKERELAKFQQKINAMEPIYTLSIRDPLKLSEDMKREHDDIQHAITQGIKSHFYDYGSDTEEEN